MKSIPLTQGKFAIVDDEDYEELREYKWAAFKSKKNRTIYAVAYVANYKSEFMHRMIMKPGERMVDHIDGDGLNNRRCNLRLCSITQNNWNSRKTEKKTSSRFKNVSWHSGRGVWTVYVMKHGKKYWGGDFDDEIEAAKSANELARKLHGDFARMNDIDSSINAT